MNLGDDKLVDLFHNKLKDRQDSMTKPCENGTAPAYLQNPLALKYGEVDGGPSAML